MDGGGGGRGRRRERKGQTDAIPGEKGQGWRDTARDARAGRKTQGFASRGMAAMEREVEGQADRQTDGRRGGRAKGAETHWDANWDRCKPPPEQPGAWFPGVCGGSGHPGFRVA